MPYAIELRFTADTERRIKEIWQAVSEFYGTTYVLENGIIPHVALLVGDNGLRAVFGELSPPGGQISLADLQFFANGRIAYLAAHLPDQLIAYQRDLYELALKHQCKLDPLYTPGRWIPHCTVAQECTANVAIEFPVGKLDADIRSCILVRYPPTEMVAEKLTEGPGNGCHPGVSRALRGSAKGDVKR